MCQRHAEPGSHTHLFVLRVQKDACAVQRLVEDGFARAFPCVLLTAKGMPDLATRIFLHKLKRLFPHLPIFGEGLHGPVWWSLRPVIDLSMFGLATARWKPTQS